MALRHIRRCPADPRRQKRHRWRSRGWGHCDLSWLAQDSEDFQGRHFAVRAVNYSGILNWSGASTQFLMVELEVAGSHVEILALVGRPAKVRRMADQLRDALGLETSPAEPGAHRIQG